MYGFGGLCLSEVMLLISELSVVGMGGRGRDKRTSWSDLVGVRQSLTLRVIQIAHCSHCCHCIHCIHYSHCSLCSHDLLIFWYPFSCGYTDLTNKLKWSANFYQLIWISFDIIPPVSHLCNFYPRCVFKCVFKRKL